MPYHHLHARQMLFIMPSRDTEYLLTGKQFIKLSKKQSDCHRIIAVLLLHEKLFLFVEIADLKIIFNLWFQVTLKLKS